MIEFKYIWDKSKYGIISSVIILSLLLIAYQYWQHQQERNLQQAALKYHELLTAETQQDAKNLATQLLSNYIKTPYAQLAAMYLAKQSAITNEWDKTIELLKQSIAINRQDILTHISRIRLSKVYFSHGKYENALELLKVDAANYKLLYEELKGDILAKLDKVDEAHTAYKSAIQAVLTKKPTPLLELKLSNLPKSP